MNVCRFVRLPIAAALAFIAAAAFVVTASAGASPFTGPRVTRALLGNGLRVAIIENHSGPIVRIGLRYRYGTSDEPPAYDGLAHALEHMMFRGTRALSGSGLNEMQGRLGAETNADTGREDTQYYATVPADRLEIELRMEADRMRGALLRDADWALERKALLEETREGAAKPTGALEDAVRARAYAGVSYAHAGGTIGALQAITAEDLRRAYAAAYAPDNALLVIAGDVEPAATLALVRRIFGPVRGHAHVARVAEPPPRRGFTLRIDGGARTLVDVALESRGFALADRNGEAVAAELLSPDHAALSDLLVEHGPCDSYVVDDDTEVHGGMYHLVCTVDYRETPARAVTAIENALRTLAVRPPNGAIARARRAYIDATAFQCDDLSAEADLFGDSLLQLDVDPRSLDRLAARITEAQVRAVLQRWTTPLAVAVSARTSVHAAAGTGTGNGNGSGNGKRSRAEKPAPPIRDEPVVQPAWARTALDEPLRLASEPADAFALANGVRVFVDRHPGNGTVYVRAGIDDPHAFGPPHFGAEGMLANEFLESGSRRWPSRRIAAVAEQRGMKIDVGTDTTAQGMARDLPVMLDVIADVWREKPAMRKSSIRDFLVSTERPERFWIAITGDVDADAVRTIVARDFGTWRAEPEPVRSPEASASPGPFTERAGRPGIHVISGGRATVRVGMILPAPPANGPDADAMMLLNTILGEGGDFDTRLMRELRTRRGFAYGAASFYRPDAYAYLVATFECAPRDLPAARASVRAVIGAMRAVPPSEPELERARRKIAVAALLARSTPDGRLDALEAARQHGTPRDPEQVLQRLESVTPADAGGVARAYFRLDRLIEMDDFAR